MTAYGYPSMRVLVVGSGELFLRHGIRSYGGVAPYAGGFRAARCSMPAPPVVGPGLSPAAVADCRKGPGHDRIILGQAAGYQLGNMFDPAYTMVCTLAHDVLRAIAPSR